MNATEIHNGYHRAKWALVVRGLLALALGLYIFARPLDSAATLALVVAVWALVDGLVMIVHAFDLRAIAAHWGVMLFSGIVSAAFGIAALDHYPGLSLTFIVIWTSFWLLAGGAFALFAAVQERRLGVAWGMTMLFGAISIVAGILAIAYPGVTIAALMAVIATFGVVGGVTLLVTAIRLQNVERGLAHGEPSLHGAGQQ
jgi:uncharacterized membrane protein HdeD (DUF308 family)